MHRAIEPGNIYIDTDGRSLVGRRPWPPAMTQLKDTDVRSHTSPSQGARTGDGREPGRPPLRHLQPRRLVHNMMAGRPPFESDNVLDLTHHIIADDVPDLRKPSPTSPNRCSVC